MQCLIEKGYELVSGGTDNHLLLVNLKNKVKGDFLFFVITIILLIYVSLIDGLTNSKILFGITFQVLASHSNKAFKTLKF